MVYTGAQVALALGLMLITASLLLSALRLAVRIDRQAMDLRPLAICLPARAAATRRRLAGLPNSTPTRAPPLILQELRDSAKRPPLV